MLDASITPPETVPDQIEWTSWEQDFLAEAEVRARPFGYEDIQAFPGSATEMVPSLQERGAWPLAAIRNAESPATPLQRLRQPHSRGHFVAVNVHDIAALQADAIREAAGITSQGLANALTAIAANAGIRGIAEGLQLNPDGVRKVLLALSSLLVQQSVQPRKPDLSDDHHGWEEFQRLLSQWKSERGISSSTHEIVMCEGYQRIIGMGRAALPLIFKQLRLEGSKPDQWFWALRAITGENPVPREKWGNRRAMAQSWLQWGEKHGYAK